MAGGVGARRDLLAKYRALLEGSDVDGPDLGGFAASWRRKVEELASGDPVAFQDWQIHQYGIGPLHGDWWLLEGDDRFVPAVAIVEERPVVTSDGRTVTRRAIVGWRHA